MNLSLSDCLDAVEWLFRIFIICIFGCFVGYIMYIMDIIGSGPVSRKRYEKEGLLIKASMMKYMKEEELEKEEEKELEEESVKDV